MNKDASIDFEHLLVYLCLPPSSRNIILSF
jgi:hypothetical protein